MAQVVTDKLRFEVFKRDQFTCQYCNGRGGELEVDHIIPVSKGGTNNIDNLVTACKACNRGKGRQRLEEAVQEPKSKRLNLLIKPTLFEILKQRAWEQHTSVNDLINCIAENYVMNE